MPLSTSIRYSVREALGATKGAVSRWVKRFRTVPESEQAQSLRAKKATGTKPRIAPEQGEPLAQLIRRGALAFGFSGDVWTARRVQSVAERELNLSAGLTTITKFLHQFRFSVQKPQVKATQSDAAAVRRFRAALAR